MDRTALALAITALAITLFAGCAGRPAGQPAAAPDVGHVGGIALVRDLSERPGEKVIVAAYLFRSDGVHPQGARVTFGSGHVPRADTGHFVIRLTDGAGAVIGEYAIWDPRRAIVEQQGFVEVPEAMHAVRFRFDARARQVRVLDPQGRVLATTDLGSALREFCAKAGGDPDCPRTGG